MRRADTDVLISGAGPTGLVLALALTRLGVRVRIVDELAAPLTTSRALAVQTRTLELYDLLDLTDQVVRDGHRVPGVNLWTNGEWRARLPLEDIAEGLTPHAFILIYPQDWHERLLIDRLAASGVTVERERALVGLDDDGSRILATLRDPSGAESRVDASFLAGCDGARSTTRKLIGAGFEGGTYRQIFYVADVEATGRATNGEIHVNFDDADFLAVFPLSSTGRIRLVGTVRDERAARADTLTFDDVSGEAIEHLKVTPVRVNWFSTYHVHHRVTDRFRRGRTFLLGDAAHIHSPVGGQGMNTGIGDAMNLAWKLAAVIRGEANDSLLDSYEAERIGFARRLVASTDRAFTVVTAEGRVANLLRTRIAPLALSAFTHIDRAREFLYRTVSQLSLNYADGPLAEGAAGDVRGGERLPWVAGPDGGNFRTLREMRWRVHVYGEPTAALVEWSERRAIALDRFPWTPSCEAAGLARDAAYLLRPDTYVGAAEPSANPAVLERYLSRILKVSSGQEATD
jgi:2-polyprenyl-6-methoxyphenol hydroxylase-like FAD-dependent oxidoreductase